MKDRYTKALVVDISHIARSVITTERAFAIYFKGNAKVLYNHPETFGLVNPELEIYKPSIIVVPSFINVKHQKVALNRENIYKRDNHQCVYCGHGNKKNLTLDHVVPQSKGGKDAWDNLVTACKQCNSDKAALSLEEYGKKIPEPRRPHYLMLMQKLNYIPDEWRTFLFF